MPDTCVQALPEISIRIVGDRKVGRRFRSAFSRLAALDRGCTDGLFRMTSGF